MAGSGTGDTGRGHSGALAQPAAQLWTSLLLLLLPSPLTAEAAVGPPGRQSRRRGRVLPLFTLYFPPQDSGQDISQVCGKPTVSGKIFGGQNAVGERWPWQASLLYHGKHICGAVLIERHWVVSAAHCFLKCVFPPWGPSCWIGLGLPAITLTSSGGRGRHHR
ncbi:putative serine protease 47 [Elephas maximus indicus]|uniref:putative serine protease 47 n=1 Tax=Elephas maximus indicus TaxID=99487 RepID=UPI002116799B|nr:putative serine protease 47 [Elephas maximus indicus]